MQYYIDYHHIYEYFYLYSREVNLSDLSDEDLAKEMAKRHRNENLS